jgi:hypothetical protein
MKVKNSSFEILATTQAAAKRIVDSDFKYMKIS